MVERNRTADVVVSVASPEDLTYVVSLMRANRESVGGLPVPAVKERVDRGTVLLARINDDPVGYVLYDNRAGVLRIPQACIQYDARRRRYGIALIQALLVAHPDADEVSLRCAADLEANVFWRDMGFVCVGTSPGGKRRGRTINSWTLWLTPRLITPQDIARVPAAQMRQDSMYDESGFLTGSPDGFAPVEVLPKLAWANRKRVPRLNLGRGVAGQVYDPFGDAPDDPTIARGPNTASGRGERESRAGHRGVRAVPS